MDTNVLLETRPIGEIEGYFFVPNYQRGYRWTSSQVEALLNDIWDSSERKEDTYCLQPIVIMGCLRGYELIDGQQRFTTILILLNYIKRRGLPIDIKFELDYATRCKTKEFIENINEEEAQSNIDFYHIYEADKTIDNWLNKKGNNIAVDLQKS